MLDNNTNSSTIKDNIDEWYKTNIEDKGYSNYIEDTVWCNDRSIYQLNGWNPEGGSVILTLRFGALDRARVIYKPDLKCSRKIDSFTTDNINGNGDLYYPVGLLTVDEFMLSGGMYAMNNIPFYLNIGLHFWSISPSFFFSNYGGVIFDILGKGEINDYYVDDLFGIRPSISLKSYTEINEGTGTINDPYIVDTN